MNKRANPIRIVAINNSDHRDPTPPGEIVYKVFGDGASFERRQFLAEQTVSTFKHFAKEFEHWPGVPAVAKVTLKEEALAKSHRPTALFTSRSCPIIGTLDYGELLVSVTKQGLEELHNRILNNQTKKQTANISSIDKIEPYTANERLHGFTKSQINHLAEQGFSIKLHLFDHKEERKNQLLINALFAFARENDIEITPLKYGETTDIMSAKSKQSNISEKLSQFFGLRAVTPMPRFKPVDMTLQMNPVCRADESQCPPPNPTEDYPIVGVIDSGICPQNNLLKPWIVAKESFVPAGLEDYNHGTMVAGLIVNPHKLNHSDPSFPHTQARIVDINAFPKDGDVSEEDLVSIIEHVIPKYPEVKVWNLSIGASSPVHETDFSDFARFLDEMHDKYQCLFVIAAGNQNDLTQWPTINGDPFENRISSPGDSIRSLTVGSLTHKSTPTTLVGIAEPSPFSRIGPGPCFIPKPEITHLGGNASANGTFAQTGVLSIGPNDMIFEVVGTSFATPIVSSQAAHVHHFLSQNNTHLITPERIKALMIHSALLSSNKVTTDTINYYGFGKPGNVIDTLYCDDNCMTLIFEADVRHGGFEFERYPFPIPDCLLTDEGKYKGEMYMTLVYSPITDKSFASEYCRTNVDAGMGSYELNKEGDKRTFVSQVPTAPKDLKKLYERAQIENGFKWSPVKAYHRKFPQGVDVNTWRLKMKVTRRAEEDKPDEPQRATLIFSMKGLDPSLPVYNEAIKKMNQAGWITTDIDQHLRIQN